MSSIQGYLETILNNPGLSPDMLKKFLERSLRKQPADEPVAGHIYSDPYDGGRSDDRGDGCGFGFHDS